MASYNKVLLIGNLTRDPQLTNLPSGTVVVEAGIAVNRKFKKSDGTEGEEVYFGDIQAFGRTAEVIAEYFHKGDPIFVEGRLRLETWEDKTSGAKRSKTRIMVERFQFIGGKRDGQQQQAPQPKAPQKAVYEEQADEDDIPF